MKPEMKLTRLREMKQAGEKFTCLTVYDATFATLLDTAGIDVLLVGDSLGMVIQGQDTTLPVTVDDMIYHCAAVRRGAPSGYIMADMPFLSETTAQRGLENAGKIMQQGGANIVKLEGGAAMLATVRLLSERGIPVCSHLGLLPQSVFKMGGYKVQGRDDKTAQQIIDDAQAVQDAGADILLLECIPAELAARVTKLVDIPVIGIGAGPECDGQVLVLYDMLGITPGKSPRFVKNFMQDSNSLQSAITKYIDEVKSSDFPASQHSYSD